MFSDLALSRRLERAEGHSCVQFVEARRKLFPEAGAEWKQCAGAFVAFDGVDSPVTQTFGLGVFEKATAESLDNIEAFFFERGSAVFHEVSPFAGLGTIGLLCDRGYRPVEIASVLCRDVQPSGPVERPGVQVRVVSSDDIALWAEISALGWAQEQPDLLPFLRQYGGVVAARAGGTSFLAEVGGHPGAAGALCIHEGVALFAGASTVPELRRRGLQSALLEARLEYARQQGCDLAMMVAEVGSQSQRNAESQGFRIAYTRIKWKLEMPSH